MYGSPVAEAGMWLLSLFSSSVQMEHQRNLDCMGFMVIREPISFVRRVVIEVPLGCRARRTVLSRVFLPFDGFCLIFDHHLISWSAPSGDERNPSHPRKVSLCSCDVVAYRCGRLGEACFSCLLVEVGERSRRFSDGNWISGIVLSHAGSMMRLSSSEGGASRHVGSGSSVHVCRHRCGTHDSTGVEIVTVLESYNGGSFLQRWSMRFWIRPVVDSLWS